VIQIDEPPAKPFCASCGNPLLWAWLPHKNAWVAFVACGCGTRYALKPHGCRHAQDPRLWRELPRGDPPSETYLEIKKQIASKETI
jgi:hypothetical protein